MGGETGPHAGHIGPMVTGGCGHIRGVVVKGIFVHVHCILGAFVICILR